MKQQLSSMTTIGKTALSKVLKIEKNVSVLDNAISEKCGGDEKLYKLMIYQTMEDIRNGMKLAEILTNIRGDKMGWRRDELRDIRHRQEEQDEFLVNPFQVEEGVLVCPKCGKSRTFSYQKQTRGADEPMTTFAQCMGCKHKWVYSG